MDNINDETRPLSKNEIYLKACCEGCGCADLPEPVSRKEQLLYQLAEILGESES